MANKAWLWILALGAGAVSLFALSSPKKETSIPPIPIVKHKECVNGVCTEVIGFGQDTCQLNQDCNCVPQNKICNDGKIIATHICVFGQLLPTGNVCKEDQIAKSCTKGKCVGTGMAGFDQCNTNADCFQPMSFIKDLWGANQGGEELSIFVTVTNPSFSDGLFRINVFTKDNKLMPITTYNYLHPFTDNQNFITGYPLQPIKIKPFTEEIFWVNNKNQKFFFPFSAFNGETHIELERFENGVWSLVEKTPPYKLLQ